MSSRQRPMNLHLFGSRVRARRFDSASQLSSDAGSDGSSEMSSAVIALQGVGSSPSEHSDGSASSASEHVDTHMPLGTHMADWHRRCRWCGRLCRYYPEGSEQNCTRCQLWYKRNGYCQIMNALCSKQGTSNKIVWNILVGPEIWTRVLDMICGSKQDMDMMVQRQIWRQVLCGKAPHPSQRELLLWRTWNTYCGRSELWRFWMVPLPQGSRALVPKQNWYTPPRILCLIIIFLGPFSEFGLNDGIRWNRGPRLATPE